nr:MAG TPA: hypothetical protein [Caudoviricetes sp.]
MSPCMGCVIRTEGCHAICMRYAAYREELEKKREKRKQELIREGGAMSSSKKQMRKRAKDEIKRREKGR